MTISSPDKPSAAAAAPHTKIKEKSNNSSKKSSARRLPPQIIVIDHRTEKESKVEAVKELIERSKGTVAGGGTRKMFKLPIKLVQETQSNKDQTTGLNTAVGS